MTQNKVAEVHMAALGDAGVELAAVYGHVARTEEKLLKFLKSTMNLDNDVKPADAVPIAKLVMAWEVCRKRTEVETEVAAQRAVNHLPPQLAIDDHQTAREAFELREGKPVGNHKIPSEAYFERKIGEMETCLKAEKLVAVTHLAEEERQKPNQANLGTALLYSGSARVAAAQAKILESQKRSSSRRTQTTSRASGTGLR